MVKHRVIVAGNTSEFQEFYLGQSKVQLFLSPCKQKGLLSFSRLRDFSTTFERKKYRAENITYTLYVIIIRIIRSDETVSIFKREEIEMERRCSFNVNCRRAIRNKLKYDLRRIDSINISFERFLNIRLLVIDRSCVANISPQGICIARGQMLVSHEILSGIRSQNKYNSESLCNQSITLIAYASIFSNSFSTSIIIFTILEKSTACAMCKSECKIL